MLVPPPPALILEFCGIPELLAASGARFPSVSVPQNPSVVTPLFGGGGLGGSGAEGQRGWGPAWHGGRRGRRTTCGSGWQVLTPLVLRESNPWLLPTNPHPPTAPHNPHWPDSNHKDQTDCRPPTHLPTPRPPPTRTPIQISSGTCIPHHAIVELHLSTNSPTHTHMHACPHTRTHKRSHAHAKTRTQSTYPQTHPFFSSTPACLVHCRKLMCVYVCRF